MFLVTKVANHLIMHQGEHIRVGEMNKCTIMTLCDTNGVRLHSIWHDFSINGKLYKHLKDQVPLIDIILVTMANDNLMKY